MKKNKKIRKINVRLSSINKLYDAANYLLQNLYDADQHINDIKEVYPDVNALEKALAKVNKTFKLKK